MNHIRIIFVLIIITLSPLAAQERYITMLLESQSGLTNSLTILTNEYVQVVSLRLQNDVYGKSYFEADAPYGESTFKASIGSGDIVTGPATLKLYCRSGNYVVSGRAVIKVLPTAFPPDRTLIIPAGTPGATVTLETSTNLLNWTTATNGFYSGTNTSQFFRINAQRVQ